MTDFLRLVRQSVFADAFDVIVDNLTLISAAYGGRCADRVLVELSARVRRILDLGPERVVIIDGGVRFVSRLQDDAALLLHVAAMPVAIGDVRIVMALRLVPARDMHRASRSESVGLDVTAFRADMKMAASVHEAALCGRTYLLVQPVDSTLDGGSLYWECLSRVVDGDDNIVSPAVFIPALERLGLARFYDTHVVCSTLDMLRNSSDISLGCNISVLSAIDDAWWSSIMAELAADPRLAGRLIIEITETAYTVDVGSVITFIDRLRRLGCRVALDDFGKGFHSLDFVRNARPDLIKIDASFLPRDPEDVAGRQLLTRLVSLGGVLADAVVVEGVEDASAYETAVNSGALWVQGYYIATPSKPSRILEGVMP